MRARILVSLILAAACAVPDDVSLPDYEWCGAQDAPAELAAETRLAPRGEPGEPLTVRGRIVTSSGAPARGVLLYVYHTNAAGVYPRRGDERGNGRRHGYLRGWMRTGPDGRYAFTTIRPGPYPGRAEPAHLHATVMPPGRQEYWIDSYVFEGDPLLTDAVRARMEGVGGPGAILQLAADGRGGWRASRDIVLEP